MNINHIRLSPLPRLKSFLVRGSDRLPRTCPFGLYRGLTFSLALDSETQIWLGLWERETYPFIRRYARRCDWAVDVGAGHGELCMYLLKRSNAERIYAIEPARRATEVLDRNL